MECSSEGKNEVKISDRYLRPGASTLHSSQSETDDLGAYVLLYTLGCETENFTYTFEHLNISKALEVTSSVTTQI